MSARNDKSLLYVIAIVLTVAAGCYLAKDGLHSQYLVERAVNLKTDIIPPDVWSRDYTLEELRDVSSASDREWQVSTFDPWTKKARPGFIEPLEHGKFNPPWNTTGMKFRSKKHGLKIQYVKQKDSKI